MELAVAAAAAAAAAAEQAKKDGSVPSPNGDQSPPGMSPLDYVKNKIVEEMKKYGEDGSILPANLKRSSPEAPAEADGHPKKKAKLEDHEANSAPPADSPGSPGDMVIDESDTTPKAASPVVVTASEANTTAAPTPTAAAATTAA